MTTDWTDELTVLLAWLEEFVDHASRDPHLFRYARDLIRLIAWLRTQPPRRATLWGVLGTGVIIAMVVASRYGHPREQSPGEPRFAEGDRFEETDWDAP